MRNSNKHNSPPVAQQRPNTPSPRRDNNHQHTTAAAPLRPPVSTPPECHKETHGKHTHTLGPGQVEDRQVESLQKTQKNQKERKKRRYKRSKRRTRSNQTEREKEAYRKLLCELWKATPHKKRRQAGTDHCSTAAGRQAAACQPTRGSSNNNQKNKQQRPQLRALWQQQGRTYYRHHHCYYLCFCYGVYCAADAKGAKKEGRLKGSRDKEKGDL
jgi:hypothetical protein